MITDNMFPALQFCSPPVDDEEATERLCELGGGSITTAPLIRITGTVFRSLSQLKKALVECKFNTFKESVLIKSGPCTTVFLKVVHSSQTKYDLVVTEYPHLLVVHNVKMVSAPYENQEDIEKFKAVIEKPEEEEVQSIL